MSLFKEEDKRRQRDLQFPIDEKKCFEMGARIVAKVRELNK